MRVLEINKELYFVLDWSEKNSNNQKNICDEDPNNGKVRYLNGKRVSRCRMAQILNDVQI